MFGTRYFPNRYFAPRYWPKVGLDPDQLPAGWREGMTVPYLNTQFTVPLASTQFTVPHLATEFTLLAACPNDFTTSPLETEFTVPRD
jgi:hypothetical protein